MKSQASMKRREGAIEEMKRGKELMDCLQSHLHLPTKASELTKGILQAFTAALAILKSNNTDHDFEREIPEKLLSSKKRRLVASVEHSRGNLKRKKPVNTWTTSTVSPHADGYQWRKYGQKKINNFNHPRCYYRCTYKDDQGCPATKLVQQDESNPTTFCVVYNNKHTCNPNPTAQPIIISLPPTNQSNFLTFESGYLNRGVKKDLKKEETLLMRPRMEYEREGSCIPHRESCSSLMNLPLSDITNEDQISTSYEKNDVLFSDLDGFQFDDVESILDLL